MIVSVASGKGGTGKTTVSASLATIWDKPLVAVDLDVEEPNLHLFLHPQMEGSEAAHLEVPVIDERKCTFCGACSDLCQFKAIAAMGKSPRRKHSKRKQRHRPRCFEKMIEIGTKSEKRGKLPRFFSLKLHRFERARGGKTFLG